MKIRAILKISFVGVGPSEKLKFSCSLYFLLNIHHSQRFTPVPTRVCVCRRLNTQVIPHNSQSLFRSPTPSLCCDRVFPSAITPYNSPNALTFPLIFPLLAILTRPRPSLLSYDTLCHITTLITLTHTDQSHYDSAPILRPHNESTINPRLVIPPTISDA